MTCDVQIVRRVIQNDDGQFELELYPLHLLICRCDPDGRAKYDKTQATLNDSPFIPTPHAPNSTSTCSH